MFEHLYIQQPSAKAGHLAALRRGMLAGPVTALDVAVAYATVGGVEALCTAMTATTGEAQRWAAVKKRWLVGIDWFRSEPGALDQLAAQPKSSVRIPDGATVVVRPGCHPRISWHPKVFIGSGADYRSVMHGSANLSRNGLTTGHEAGSLFTVEAPSTPAEQDMYANLGTMVTWFAAQWKLATDYSVIASDYATRYRTESIQRHVPTDDDTTPSRLGARARDLTPDRIKALRICDNFWIQSGTLTKNHGPNRPGGQLMMSPMTRVFFGFPAVDVPTDTPLGMVTIRKASAEKSDCSLRYSNNSMDVLTLPVPGSPWPMKYDSEVLLFRRVLHAGRRKFELSVGSAAQIKAWTAASSTQGTLWSMSSGRQFGTFT